MVKKAMIEHVKKKPFDEYVTPLYAVYPLLKYIPSDVRVVWEPADCGASGVREVLEKEGFRVISTCQDFLSIEPDFSFDAIITNPPYSLKDQFLERCYSFRKFFALLMPLTALEGIKRNRLYRAYGINLIVFDRRVEFVENKKGVWFPVGWFFWGPDLERNRIFFEELPRWQR